LSKWFDVKGFEDYLEANKKGVIRTKNKTIVYYPYGKKRIIKLPSRVLPQNPTSKGYLTVWFTHNKKNQSKKVHRLIAETFVPNPQNKAQVNHIDGNKKNNSVKNLEWVTQEENMNHAKINGLINQPKVKWEDNYKIKEMYDSGKYTQKQIADFFGCSQSNISYVIKKIKKQLQEDLKYIRKEVLDE